MKKYSYRFLSFLLLVLCFTIHSKAQKQLPEIELISEQAENVLSWFCQFDGVKAISVQRSADSVRNFTTIGMLNNPKKGNQYFRDLHPVVGKNYYRLSIEFGSDLEWFSNTYKSVIDSATFMKAIVEKTKLAEQKEAEIRLLEQASASKRNTTVGSTTSRVPEIREEKPIPPKPEVFTFMPSEKIYTDPFSGHVQIKLEDALSRHYNIRFYDPAKNEVLRISRVSKSLLILDKNNFNSRGIYGFTLFDGNEKIESGYVTIY
ncbi:MAG: hypothetical protein IPI46_04200 [Bacteroidetes bacterium]|nr:hypothetical protein [Bacteroidota bacterium]